MSTKRAKIFNDWINAWFAQVCKDEGFIAALALPDVPLFLYLEPEQRGLQWLNLF
jgi:hypothetical protein